jgi:hypothetical protein
VPPIKSDILPEYSQILPLCVGIGQLPGRSQYSQSGRFVLNGQLVAFELSWRVRPTAGAQLERGVRLKLGGF